MNDTVSLHRVQKIKLSRYVTKSTESDNPDCCRNADCRPDEWQMTEGVIKPPTVLIVRFH